VELPAGFKVNELIARQFELGGSDGWPSKYSYTPSYTNVPPTPLQTYRHCLTSPHMSTPGLDTLAEGSQYALHQLQHPSMSSRQMLPSSVSPVKARYDPYTRDQNGAVGTLQRRDSGTENRGAVKKNSTSAPVRRRISRACDQCNQLRTKGDGKAPCAHCVGKFSVIIKSGAGLTMFQSLD